MHHKINSFIKDRHGKTIIWQSPNTIICLWAAAALFARLFSSGKIHTLFELISFGAIFTWSWLEITKGLSPFRRMLGAVVLVFSIYGRL